jgi:ACS family glucarate transporter-like MFS transporter
MDDVSSGATTDGQAATGVRYVVLGAACSVALIAYVHRVGFAIGAPEVKADLGLSDAEMGYLLSAFFWTYGLFQVPSGWLGDRLGSRHLLTFLVLGWSLATGAIGLVVYIHPEPQQFWFLFALRFLFGTFQAGAFPLLSRITADWLPVTLRGTAQGLIWTSGRLGGAVIPLVMAPLFAQFGTWRTPFWILAAVGLVWCVAFWPWFRDTPEESTTVNDAERALIVAGRAPRKAGRHSIPWAKMLRSRSAWSLCLAYGFMGFSSNFYLGWLPTYLRDQRHLSAGETKWLTSLPLACGVIACLFGGALSDWIIRRTGDRSWGRKLNGTIGMVVAGLATGATVLVDDVGTLGFLLCLSFACSDLAMGPAWASCADIGERSAGTLGGAMNMMANVGGAIAALIAGYLFQHKQPVLVFLIFSASYLLASLSWLGVDAGKPIGQAEEKGFIDLDLPE